MEYYVSVEDIPDTPEGNLLRLAIEKIQERNPELHPNQILKMLEEVRDRKKVAASKPR